MISLNNFASFFSLIPTGFQRVLPSMNDACAVLECVWVKDKFVLHEKVKDICQETQAEDQKCCGPESPIQYETLALISEG